MAYKKGDEKSFFPILLAVLIALAIAVSGAIYSLVKYDPGDIPYDDLTAEDFSNMEVIEVNNLENVEVLKDKDGTFYANPSGGAVPSGPPGVPFPAGPPPSS